MKKDTDIIHTGVKCISEFANDDLIPHFILCTIHSVGNEYKKTFKEIFLPKMREYGLRSAILTMLYSGRSKLTTKEKVKQKYLDAHEAELTKDRGALIWRSLNEDLESFYTSCQNPESKPKAEVAYSFVTQKLNEEELRLLDERNEDYLNTFHSYNRIWMDGREDSNRLLLNAAQRFNKDIEEIGKSSDPESKFSYTFCGRWTFALHVTLKSMQAAMRKRASNEDMSNVELKKKCVYWFNQKQTTLKFVKKA